MTTKKVQLYKNGKSYASLGNRQNWWFDIGFEHSFTIFDVDYFYQKDYFRIDHVDNKTIQFYVDYVIEYGTKLLNRNIKSILELGSGGGWFTAEFLRRGIDIIAVEASTIGIQKSIERGIPKKRLIQHDLRLPFKLDRNFDMAVCTEVAEHIEPPFSSQFINNIVNYSKLVWFSFEEPGTNPASYDHCNEQPEKFWKSLFNFFGYNMIVLPKDVKANVGGRGGYIFYSKELQHITDLYKLEASTEKIYFSLGIAPQKNISIKNFVKKLIPPIIFDFRKSVKNRKLRK